MSRPLRLVAGAGAAVAAVLGAREVTRRYVPVAARAVLGAAARVAGAGQRVAAEFRAGRAEREAELRADLLAGADPTRARAHVDAWRTGRAEPSGTGDSAADGPVGSSFS